MKKMNKIAYLSIMLAAIATAGSSAFAADCPLSNVKQLLTNGVKIASDKSSCGNSSDALNQLCNKLGICIGNSSRGSGCQSTEKLKSIIEGLKNNGITVGGNNSDCTGGSCGESDQIQNNADVNQYIQQIIEQLRNNTNTKDDSKNEADVPSSGEQTPDVDMAEYAERVVEIVNEERAKNGLSALTVNYTALSAADVRASEIAGTFSHTRPNGTKCFTALDEAGVSYMGAGENIAMGQRTPEEVMEAWMNSSGHRANILNSSFKQIAVSYKLVNGTPCWVQLFTY